MYLGANIRKWQVQNECGEDVDCIAMCANSYIKEAVRTVEERMKEHNLAFQSKRYSKTPFTSSSYRTELKSSEFCQPSLISFYQSMVGMRNWSPRCVIGNSIIVSIYGSSKNGTFEAGIKCICIFEGA